MNRFDICRNQRAVIRKLRIVYDLYSVNKLLIQQYSLYGKFNTYTINQINNLVP